MGSLYLPNESKNKADLVNLGFVVNVIEEVEERIIALKNAYDLTNKILVIGVMLTNQKSAGKPYRDGYLTSRNTFQKYFTPQELLDFIKDNIHENAIPISPGVVFVFKDKLLEQKYLLGQTNARKSLLRINRVKKEKTIKQKRNRKLEKYENNKELLENLWFRWLELGRQPKIHEIENIDELRSKFNSINKALSFISQFKDTSVLEKAKEIRKK